MTLRVTWPQALAWRMERQLIEPLGTLCAVDVVRRLCGVQAQVASSAELAVRLRQRNPRANEVADALGDGRLIKTWANRGTLHLLPADEAGIYLSLLADGRSWETPAWERYFGLTAAQIEELRDVVRDILDGKVLTREEVNSEIVKRPGYEHLGDELKSGWGTLFKPLVARRHCLWTEQRDARDLCSTGAADEPLATRTQRRRGGTKGDRELPCRVRTGQPGPGAQLACAGPHLWQAAQALVRVPGRHRDQGRC